MLKKPKTYGMKQATEAGISKLVRDAEESGAVLLQRNGVPVAIMISVSPDGRKAMREAISQAMTEDAQRLRDNPDLAVLANAMMGLLEHLPGGTEQRRSATRKRPGKAG